MIPSMAVRGYRQEMAPEDRSALRARWAAYRRALVKTEDARAGVRAMISEMEGRGYSQASIARALGVPRQDLNRLMRIARRER